MSRVPGPSLASSCGLDISEHGTWFPRGNILRLSIPKGRSQKVPVPDMAPAASSMVKADTGSAQVQGEGISSGF